MTDWWRKQNELQNLRLQLREAVRAWNDAEMELYAKDMWNEIHRHMYHRMRDRWVKDQRVLRHIAKATTLEEAQNQAIRRLGETAKEFEFKEK
jgi:hypothetical protein